MKYATRQTGFTVPELVVVIVFVVIAIMLSLIFIHPKNYDRSNRNIQRQLDIAQLAQAFNAYYADHGVLPDGVIEQPSNLSTADPVGLDVCADLVPKYLKDLPIDPLIGVKPPAGACTQDKDKTEVYATGYTIAQQKDGTVVLDAPAAEGEKIAYKRKY